MPDSVCLLILLVWQAVHVRAQCVESLLMPGQTNFCVINFVVVLLDGWERPWMTSKMSLRLDGGIYGRGRPVLVSQRRVAPP